jgi:hypothetical protein
MSARHRTPKGRRSVASGPADQTSPIVADEQAPPLQDPAEALEPAEPAPDSDIPADASDALFDVSELGELFGETDAGPVQVPDEVPDDEPPEVAPEPPVTEDAAGVSDAEGAGSAEDAPDGAPRRWIRPVRRRRAGRAHRQQGDVATAEAAAGPPPSTAVARVRMAVGRGAKTALAVVLIIGVLVGALYGLVVGVNAFARWNARRIAAAGSGPTTVAGNLLVIGVRDGVAVGFTALKAERASARVLGIAIPDGAFVEVPGQGFERIGSSYVAGPDVSKDTVSNYLGVPFRRYVVVDGDSYQAFLRNQSVVGLMSKVSSTDLTSAERASLTTYFASVKAKNVWIASLPVKPVAVGDQRYYEPQRAQVADLLLQWWGVKVSEQKSTPRVIVYNGVGTPGLAGLAAQQLIRGGFSVVNSGNAQNFAYATTQILLYHGTQADAQAVRNVLGAGQISVESAPQQLTDMIVIIGADYRPPIDASTVPTEGVQ